MALSSHCMHVCCPAQARPHLLALACDDAFVRVYDRRMLCPTGAGSSGRSASGQGIGQPVLKLAPAHLQTGEAQAHGMTAA